MSGHQIKVFEVLSLSDKEKKTLTDFMYNLIHNDDIEVWLGTFIHSIDSIHDLTGRHRGQLMNFHLSLFMSVLMSAPDCDQKNVFIDEAIELLNTNRATTIAS